MRCSKCGAELSEDTKFCSYCGNKVEMPSKQETVSEEDIPPIPSDGQMRDSQNQKEPSKSLADKMKEKMCIRDRSKTAETGLEVVEGMQFDRGYISPYMVTDTDKMEAIVDDPYLSLIHIYAVGVQLRVGDLKIHDGVDLHGDVVLGDDGLGRVIEHLLLEAHLFCHALNERGFEVDADLPDLAERAEALHNVGARLLHLSLIHI